MATSLEEKLVDIAREFEETKSRQLELYQRQLRRAREQLQERDTELADKIEELEYTKHNAEEAEASRAIEADNALMLTREVIALKFQLADAFEKLMEQVPPKAACSEAGSDEVRLAPGATRARRSHALGGWAALRSVRAAPVAPR